MNKNSIIGFVLIFAVLLGYTYLTAPSKEEQAEKQRVQDSITQVHRLNALKDSILAAEDLIRTEDISTSAAVVKENTNEVSGETTETAEIGDSEQQLKDKYSIFSQAAIGEEKTFILESDLHKLTISSKSGRIIEAELKDYQTYDTLPLILFKEATSSMGFTFFVDNRRISTQEMYFTPLWVDDRFQDQEHIVISGEDSVTFAMRMYAGEQDVSTSKYIEYIYTLRSNEYMVDFDINFIGLGNEIDLSALDLEWKTEIFQNEKSLKNERMVTSIYYQHKNEDVDNLSERKDDEEEIASRLKWISFKQQFFGTTLIANEDFSNAFLKLSQDEGRDEEGYVKTAEAIIGLPATSSDDQQFGMRLFMGPLKYRTMRQYKLDLERQLPLGWSFPPIAYINRFAVIPVFNFFESKNLNYGIIILILTVLLKLVLFPIAYKTYMSSAKMRVLKPEVDEIGKKFPKKEDSMKKQQATMALYRSAGANPMSGCVPMLLQFPILLAMFRFFPASIELRQESFLWATDLSSYDSILDLPFTIPFYGDHVSLFTLLMTVSTLIYTRMNNQMMAGTSQQMPGMKTMMYLMPIMFLGFFNSYASGLSYYYFLANVITFSQMYLIRRFVNEDAIHAKIALNKKKPQKKKKSSFQKRMEDMAKKRGIDPRTGKPIAK